ncbi:alpha/beta hydrolase [Panacibacter sp. DH6]|uniref:Alpha/beta hydrolase n=1 Tax=Panacibacter microcysteis TaxID=2793269 RepID=A0A931GTM3_9BACT|nr:alpha/beta hydrolase [Panacibacter microcysteis]MBG9375716.1 alpha/beta hydrolase [Panacibacter microcysteis]
MLTRFISYKNSEICFHIYGTGSRVAVCFHGFGEDAATFEPLQHFIGDTYTFLCINLPYHACTVWNGGLTFTPQDLFAIIDLALAEGGITTTAGITLCGYSMGGRIALGLLQSNPEKINQAVLIAPDGLHTNFWYFMATQTAPGNWLFKVTMQNPAWFFALVNIGKAMGLLNKSIVKFVHYYLDDKAVRALLYKRWTTLRKFNPSKKRFREAVSAHTIHVHFIFGAHDRIILSKRAHPFATGLPMVKQTILPTGHSLLKEQHIKNIAAAFC